MAIMARLPMGPTSRAAKIFPSTAADASKAAARPTQDRAMRGGKGGNELDWYMSNMGWFSAMAGGKGGDRYQPY
ncbi:unnamed protein product [Cladocopium goreaui]|uniref:Uncharacterized protein n=1 Tax=Cladocopium goreaui TaxID=2562237 RepID=A0A9P1GKU1_9DINO|nr:unnamed protein product [Cladocopium goreaui]